MIEASRRKIRWPWGLAAGLILLLAGLKTVDTLAQSAAGSVMPASGSCAFMINLPVPYGVNVAANVGSRGSGAFETGGSLLGVMSFTSAGGGTFSASVVNPTYVANNSPAIYASSNIYFNNGAFRVVPMTTSDGFQGGYRVFFSGRINGGSAIGGWEANMVPVNSGKSLLIQLANSDLTDARSGIGPGGGICQFQ